VSVFFEAEVARENAKKTNDSGIAISLGVSFYATAMDESAVIHFLS
jgi:hypothetical protein